MQHESTRASRAVAGAAARDRTARRLLMERLRQEIARREAARPSDPRIEQARQQLRALTGVRPAPVTGAGDAD